MPSTYTTNNGIELIATGEQSGTWGTTTNTNLELLDASLDGQVTVTLASTGTSGSPNTLPISDGSASNGRNRLVIFNDGTDLGGTAYVQLTPNNAEKIVYVRNNLSASRSILLFQGTYNASNDYEVPAGTTAVVFFDGAGSGAVAANVFNNAHFDALNLAGNATITGSVDITGDLDVDNININGNTIISTNANGNITLTPNGTGSVAIAAASITGGSVTGITDIAIADGGTGASTASDARGNLGLTIGTNVLAYDSNLQSFVTAFTLPTSDGTANQVLQTNGSGTLSFASTGSGDGSVTSVGLSGGTTGLSVTGSPITSSGTITLGGTLVLANGGTGATTASGARSNLGLTIGTNVLAYDSNLQSFVDTFTLPTSDGSANQVLQTDGSGTLSFASTGSGDGTVTSVGLSGGTTGLSVTGSPITSSGTITLGGTLVVANGGTGATTASDARTNLGLVIGTNVQAYSSVLANTTASFTTSDETKLDGIEANADVTDTTNVTAAGALMDSELASEASVKAINQGLATTDSPTFATANVTNLYASTNIGKDSGDYITFTTDTQMDVYINGSNEFRFEADGDFHADGNIVAYSTTVASDAALKENIKPVLGLQSVMALDGVSFDWKRDGKKSAGVIAQQVQKIMPEAVTEVKAMDGSKHLSVNYNALTSVLIEAIKDLKIEIEELRNASSK